MTDYYEVFSVSRNATSADIRNAYQRLARQWHPDKNLADKEQATKKFAEISEAYEVLSDERRKNIYDQTGVKGLQQNGGTRTFIDPEKLFKDFFGDDDPISFPDKTPSYMERFFPHCSYPGNLWQGGGSKTETVTVQVNGKTVTTEKVQENGEETVSIFENGVLTSRKIDSVSVM